MVTVILQGVQLKTEFRHTASLTTLHFGTFYTHTQTHTAVTLPIRVGVGNDFLQLSDKLDFGGTKTWEIAF